LQIVLPLFIQKSKIHRDSVLIQTYTSIKVGGEIHYLERECLFTFTVKNLSSGNTFEISGTWKQKYHYRQQPISMNNNLGDKLSRHKLFVSYR
jgi:hypothetical protein